ncbi:hypothetical protein BBBOND_0307830 [Babesia bigemina]|uniref:Ribosome-binding protein 1 n=1 Tax=Babesia bigemina TaxID=5866 RepID=A0A061DCT7_BABBI|nr:hypothetical protein BBBOND_0307830 [Babesia bigemina]CDR96879.1 hypothetical protein BBBOND_0307830 [Babesia bigemina]|eukprot:XP_012769065.1 hypothetical protein BBBOND_0307830 [Babesia bigemina]
MATSIRLDTLKDCLQFLEWLYSGKGKSIQPQVATALADRLKYKYNDANTGKIASALSAFLTKVNTFHKKLCSNAQSGSYGGTQPIDVLNALLQCIPKFFASLYFLRYNVDVNFKAVGGGEWAEKYVAYYHNEPLDKYLYATYKEQQYGVIPGGFKQGEVKNWDTYHGYIQGKHLLKHITDILNKYSTTHNFFLDVFSTSVIPDYGTHDSNTANVLALVRSFCDIVKNENNQRGGELIKKLNQDLVTRGASICWDNLKAHCETLKTEFSKIFTDQRFSFTGYGREPKDLSNENFAQTTAAWLRNNLKIIKMKLEKIQPFDTTKVNFNSKLFRNINVLLPTQSKAFADYFTDNFFQYEFTFYSNKYETRSTQYADLFKNWQEVISMLRNTGGGLDRLTTILDGELCPQKGDEEHNDDKKLEDEDASPEPEKVEAPPAKVPETPKEVVPEKKVAAPKKPEVPLEINSAGNQNQGKKAESAQNQGKKAEGNQNQGNDHSVANTSISPVSQAVRTQSSSVQSPDSGSPGATGPSSGPGPGGQADVSDAGQPGVQKAQANGDANGTASNTPGAGSVGDVGNGGSGGPGHQGENPQVPVDNCPSSKGFMKIKLWRDGGTYCVRQADYNEQEKRNKKWDEQQREYDKRMEQIRIEEQEAQQKQEVNQGRKDARAYRKEVVNDQRETLESMERKPQQIHDQYPSELRQMQQEQLLALEGSVITNTKPRAHMDVDKVYRHTLSDVDGRMISDTDRAVVAFYGDEFGRGEIPPVEAVPSTKSHVSDVIGMPTASIAVPAPPVSYHPSRENRLGMIPPPVEENPSTNDQRDSTLKPDDISVGGSVIPMMPFPGVYNIELSLPQKPKVQVIPNPKQRSPLPPIALSEYSGHHYYIPSKYPFIATVDDQTVEKMLNVTGTSNKLQTAQIVGDSNVATLSTPELTGNIISAFKQDPRTSRFPPTSKPYGDDDDASVEYASAVTFNDNIMKTMAGVAGHPVVGTNGQVDISQIPTAISLDAGDIHHLEGQEIEDSFTMKRQEQDLLNFQNEELKQGSQNAQRERELLALKQESDHINEEQKKLMQAAQVDADRIRAFKDSQFDISSAPLRVDEMQFDIQIDVPKRPLQDSSYDIDLDDPYANTADILKDELKPSDDEGFSGLPNTNFDLNFAPERIGLDGYEDPGMPSDSPRKASERVINPFSTDECLNPWSVDTSSTDIINPPPSSVPVTDHLPPPRTVREMLYWFVGLNTQGLIAKIESHIKSILNDISNDASQSPYAIEVTGYPTALTASMVTSKLTEACLYSATVIYKIRHNNDFKAFSTFDFKSEYTKFCYSPDAASLLCQLRDYVYACHYQLEFLKSQCNRDKLSGGWKNDEYGSDITSLNSPLQAFLTDDWDSDFETHLFDPCNLCLKSRVRMGFRDEDLPNLSQSGSVISTILTPSCGGDDPLLTLSSYLNCLTNPRILRTTNL